MIDAYPYKKALGRFANDAKGLKRIKGINNNSVYVYKRDKDAVFIEATTDIPPKSEILVDYGKEYWDVIRHNAKLAAEEARTKAATQKKPKKK